jgi:hypothetical protein
MARKPKKAYRPPAGTPAKGAVAASKGPVSLKAPEGTPSPNPMPEPRSKSGRVKVEKLSAKEKSSLAKKAARLVFAKRP